MLKHFLTVLSASALVVATHGATTDASAGDGAAADNALPSVAQTGTGSSDSSTKVSFAANGGTLSAAVGTSSSGGGGSGGSSAAGPASYKPSCSWTPVSSWEGPSNISDTGVQLENDQGELGWLRACGDDEQFVWAAPAAQIDPIDLVPGAAERAFAQLPFPEPNMSPAADVGSVANLGLWFSIADPGVTTARATIGDVWAEVTGTFDHVSIDPGTGDRPITCDGLGTPYRDGSQDPDEGPCGYTYLQSSPEDDPYQMTYTITYDITWATSDGRSGDYGTYDRPLTFDYDVDEIQIVGSR